MCRRCAPLKWWAPTLRDRLYRLGLSSPAAGRRLLRLQPGAGRRRHPPAGAGQRLPHPGQSGLASPTRWTLATSPSRSGSWTPPAASSSPTSRPTAPRARAPSAWRARYSPVTGARSRPAPARTCATTGRWASRQRTVAVWVGNAAGEPMWDVSGMHGAAPVWQAVLDRAAARRAGLPAAAPPPGVVSQNVRYEGDVGSQPPRMVPGRHRARADRAGARQRRQPDAGHRRPGGWQRLRAHPDIPPANQRLLLARARRGPPAMVAERQAPGRRRQLLVPGLAATRWNCVTPRAWWWRKSVSKCAARWPHLSERPANQALASTSSRKRRLMP